MTQNKKTATRKGGGKVFIMAQKYIKPCQRCGRLYTGIAISKYCESCRLAMRTEYQKRYEERRDRGNNRVLGHKYICENCGCEYTLSGSLQKYCKRCSDKLRKENDVVYRKTDKIKKYNADKNENVRKRIRKNNVTRNANIETFSGVELKKIRESKKLSLSSFCRKAGYVSHGSFLSHEKNKDLHLTLENFKKISNALDVDLYYLLSTISNHSYTDNYNCIKTHKYDGGKLTLIRQKQALSLNKLSSLSGLTSTNLISDLEKKKGEVFDKIRINTLAYIANALGNTVIELLQKLEIIDEVKE